jgi:hypothetical protein
VPVGHDELPPRVQLSSLQRGLAAIKSAEEGKITGEPDDIDGCKSAACEGTLLNQCCVRRQLLHAAFLLTGGNEVCRGGIGVAQSQRGRVHTGNLRRHQAAPVKIEHTGSLADCPDSRLD